MQSPEREMDARSGRATRHLLGLDPGQNSVQARVLVQPVRSLPVPHAQLVDDAVVGDGGQLLPTRVSPRPRFDRSTHTVRRAFSACCILEAREPGDEPMICVRALIHRTAATARRWILWTRNRRALASSKILRGG